MRGEGDHAEAVSDDRVPGTAASTTAVYRCSLCPDVVLNGNDSAPECPNGSWHEMVREERA